MFRNSLIRIIRVPKLRFTGISIRAASTTAGDQPSGPHVGMSKDTGNVDEGGMEKSLEELKEIENKTKGKGILAAYGAYDPDENKLKVEEKDLGQSREPLQQAKKA